MTRRDGFTFIEMLLVLVLGMILLAGVYGTLMQQEEAYAQFNAMAGTQQDARAGLALLSSEIREVSPEHGDLVAATGSSITIRGLRQFGIVCGSDKNNKRFVVGMFGVERFQSGDSIMVFADGDSLVAWDDAWQREALNGVSSTSSCSGGFLGGLGLAVSSLLDPGSLDLISISGAGLKFDSIYPGAPIRGFEHTTYRVGDWQGQPMLQQVDAGGNVAPLFGPVADPGGLAISYFDTIGNPLTSLPLTAADRRSVGRLQVELQAERRTGAVDGAHTESLITDIYFRGN